ncbi:Peptidase family M23 [Pedobacter rhizosphaerae]|uniref:Peptidase family M23 n=2 Tax=Pedobacter rhizosphaerae TaxID=390241 RepID=A0A1H9N6U4_9SPHI|nr:Peptidase family M23 [Pedobacter rhizosphaerae]
MSMLEKLMGLLLIGMQGAFCHAQRQVVLPLDSLVVTSGFGPRIHPVLRKGDFHRGVDLRAKQSAVKTVMAGRVSSCGYNPILGNFVCISHGKLESIYGHLSFAMVSPGEWLEAGKVIGVSGNSGRTTAAHLHFALRYQGIFLDPIQFLFAIRNSER